MTLDIRRQTMLTGGAMALLVAVALGFLVWTAWHSAGTALARGDTQAATEFRLLAALLLVTVVFLVVIAALLATHVGAMTAIPMRELGDGLRRIRHGGPHERVVPDGPAEVRAVATELNALAATLAQGSDRLEKMVEIRTIDGIMYGVAHEVHTPLTSLTLDNHLLERRLRAVLDRADVAAELRVEVERGLRHVERTRAVHERLERLTRSLREAVRPEGTADRRDINLVVGAAVALTHHRAPAGVRVETRLAATRMVASVGTQLFHAVHGLMLQASDDVDPQGVITVATEDSADGVLIAVRYNGRPVATEILEVLDDPGLSDEDLPALPLKSVQRFVREGGGTLDYDGTSGDGGQWRVRLPAAPPAG